MGYKRGGPVFYVATQNLSLEEAFVTNATKKGWSKLWQKTEKEFKSVLNSSRELKKFLNRMFYIWDGNHKLLAWYPSLRPTRRTIQRSTFL